MKNQKEIVTKRKSIDKKETVTKVTKSKSVDKKELKISKTLGYEETGLFFMKELLNLSSILKKNKKDFFKKLKELYLFTKENSWFKLKDHIILIEHLFELCSKKAPFYDDYEFRRMSKSNLEYFIKKNKLETFAEFIKIADLLSISVSKKSISPYVREFDMAIKRIYSIESVFIEYFGEKINSIEEYMLPETLYIPCDVRKNYSSCYNKQPLYLNDLTEKKENILYIGIMGTFSDLDLLHLLKKPELIHNVFSYTEKTQSLLDNLTLNLSFHSFNYNELNRLHDLQSSRMDNIENNLSILKNSIVQNQEKLNKMLEHISNKILEVHSNQQSIQAELNAEYALNSHDYNPLKGRTGTGTALAGSILSAFSQSFNSALNQGLYKMKDMDFTIDWIIPKLEKFNSKSSINEIKCYIEFLLKRKAFVLFNNELFLVEEVEILDLFRDTRYLL